MMRVNTSDLAGLGVNQLAQTCGEEKERLEFLQDQIAELNSGLGKLYDAPGNRGI